MSLLIQTIIEYVKEHHQGWEISIPYSDTIVLNHPKYTTIWLFFYEHPNQCISIQYYNVEISENKTVQYNEHNILEITDDIINKAEEYYKQ